MSELLEGVERPIEGLLKYDDVISTFRNMKISKRNLKKIENILINRNVIDMSGYSGNSTILVPKEKNKEGYCIKISSKINQLKKEKELLELFSSKKLTADIIDYIQDGMDILITRQMEGEEAIKNHSSIRSLSEFMGKSLREFHDLSQIFKVDDDTKKTLILNGEKIIKDSLIHSKGLQFMGDYQKDHDYDKMKKYIQENLGDYHSDVIIHGDFNPRNVFSTNKGEFTGFVDVTDSGYGDRHYDIFWTMWTISLYLGVQGDANKVKECEEIFLDAYGTDAIDERRMQLCKKLTCMYWQESNDIKYFR